MATTALGFLLKHHNSVISVLHLLLLRRMFEFSSGNPDLPNIIQTPCVMPYLGERHLPLFTDCRHYANISLFSSSSCSSFSCAAVRCSTSPACGTVYFALPDFRIFCSCALRSDVVALQHLRRELRIRNVKILTLSDCRSGSSLRGDKPCTPALGRSSTFASSCRRSQLVFPRYSRLLPVLSAVSKSLSFRSRWFRFCSAAR